MPANGRRTVITPMNRRELLDKYETLISPAPRFRQAMSEDILNFATDVFSGQETAEVIKKAAEGSIFSAGCAIEVAASFAERLTRITKTDAVLFAHDDISALDCAVSIALDYSASHYGDGREGIFYIDDPLDLDPQGIPEGTCAVVFSVFDKESAKPFSQEHYRNIFTLAVENDLLTIADERSVGFMRTGSPTVCLSQELRPDITIVGGLGGGLPLTLCLLTGDAAHSALYGAQPNPIICSVAESVLKRLTAKGIESFVSEKGEKFAKMLETTEKFESVSHSGLFISAVPKNSHLHRLAVRKGLLCTENDGFIIFKPPFDVTDEQLERAISIILSADER